MRIWTRKSASIQPRTSLRKSAVSWPAACRLVALAREVEGALGELVEDVPAAERSEHVVQEGDLVVRTHTAFFFFQIS